MNMGISWIVVVFLVATPIFDSISFAAAVCSGSGQDPTISAYYSTARTGGDATYYGVYTSGGACTLDPTPPAGLAAGVFSTVAIADNIWGGSTVCGMCINLTATGSGSGASPLSGSYLVYVNNECPSCVNNGIDLGLSGDGSWGITWTAVPCPVGSTSVQYLLAGSNSYYIKVQVRNTRYPVHAVSIQQGGAWQALARTADNFFTAGSTVTFPLVFPLSVQITASTGDVVQDSIPSLTNGVVIQGSVQFPLCSTSSSSASASTATSATTSHAATTTSHAATTTTGHAASTTTGHAGSTGSAIPVTVAPTSGPKLVVYDDSLENGFADWSWDTSYSLTDTTYVHSGTHAIKMAVQSTQAIYFHTSSFFSLGSYNYIQFYVNGGTVAIPANELGVIIYDSTGAELGSTYLYPSAVPALTWVLVSVPLSTFGSASTQLSGLAIQGDVTTVTGDYFWIDDVAFTH